MENNKKKIIFLDDSLEGGEEREQFRENTQFKVEGGENESSEVNLDSEVDVSGGSDVESVKGDVESVKSDVESDYGENIVDQDGGEDMSDTKSVNSDMSGLISEGGRSSVSSGSSVSSVGTADLLAVDPMYIRLTKFLETNIKLEGGGEKKVNLTELLYDISGSLNQINTTFKEMSTVLQKMAVNNVSK